MNISKFPLKAFLYANLTIGLFVVLANGAAIAMVFAGRGGAVSDRVPEMVAWCAAGILLLSGAVYGHFRPPHLLASLQFQMYVVLALVFAIAGRALFALSRASVVDTQMVWGPGFFTVLVIYTAVLVSRLFDSAGYRWLRLALVWIGIPSALLLDLAMAFRG